MENTLACCDIIGHNHSITHANARTHAPAFALLQPHVESTGKAGTTQSIEAELILSRALTDEWMMLLPSPSSPQPLKSRALVNVSRRPPNFEPLCLRTFNKEDQLRFGEAGRNGNVHSPH